MTEASHPVFEGSELRRPGDAQAGDCPERQRLGRRSSHPPAHQWSDSHAWCSPLAVRKPPRTHTHTHTSHSDHTHTTPRRSHTPHTRVTSSVLATWTSDEDALTWSRLKGTLPTCASAATHLKFDTRYLGNLPRLIGAILYGPNLS